MAIETFCTGCGQKLSVADENAGKRARCPACGQIYTIPSASTTQSGRANIGGGTSGGANSGSDYNPAPLSASTSGDSQPPEGVRYWMRAVDGNEYGPVDQATLDRWFREGRVGPGYQIRQSEFGNWQSSDIFRPKLQAADTQGTGYSNNPYSPVDTSAGMYRYPKTDKSVQILVLGILGFACCFPFGIAAWVMGHSALKDIEAGLVDPNSKGLVQAGYYIGMASVILSVFCMGGQLLLTALSAIN